MANQAARRNYRGRVDGDFLPFRPRWSTSAVTNFYEGSAVIVQQQAGTGSQDNDGQGSLSSTLDGTVQGVFAGVVLKNTTVPVDTDTTFAAGPDFTTYGIVVQRHGTVRFNAVSGYTPAASDIGRFAWFHSDNEVSTSPKTGASNLYPVWAGTIVGFPSATEVEVDISQAVGRRSVPQMVSFTLPAATIGALNANTVEFLAKAAAATATSWQWGRRVYVNRMFVHVLLAVDVATVNLQHSKNNAAYATIVSVATTDTAGKWLQGVIQATYEATDCMGLATNSAGNVTTGELGVHLEVYPMQ